MRTGLRWAAVAAALGSGALAQALAEQWLTRPAKQFLADPTLAIPAFLFGAVLLTLAAERSRADT